MQEMITGTRASSLCSTAAIRKVPREDEEEKEKRRERDEEEKEGQQERRESDKEGEQEMDTKGKRRWSAQQKETPPQKSPRKRKGFSRKDEDLVADFFAQNIAKRRFPTADECRDFIKMYPQFSERKPKDIYDKCRNLAGR